MDLHLSGVFPFSVSSQATLHFRHMFPNLSSPIFLDYNEYNTYDTNISNDKPGLQIYVRNWKLFFLFLNQNICCGYSKEPSQWEDSFEHPKHMVILLGKKIITILRSKFLLNWTYDKLWANTWYFGTYHIRDQGRLRQGCLFEQFCQRSHCSLTPSMEVDLHACLRNDFTCMNDIIQPFSMLAHIIIKTPSKSGPGCMKLY